MKQSHIIFTMVIISAVLTLSVLQYVVETDKPKISFSFDDGLTRDFPNYANAEWNALLLDHLQQHKLKAILFVKGKNLDNGVGANIIKSWDDAGHLIANHTYSHPYYNSKKVSLESFKQELLKNDSLINGYTNYAKLFRFPYLKEGNTVEKRDGFRAFLRTQKYKIGHVTIDGSDWYINQRLVQRLEEDTQADISGFRDFYLDHIFDRATYYNELSTALTGRQIHHNVLLHHNLSSALFVGELIQHFKDNGWEVIDAEKAYQDPIYSEAPKTMPAGESLIWALAKQTGMYDSILRYPAEDSRYEKAAMDSLGL